MEKYSFEKAAAIADKMRERISEGSAENYSDAWKIEKEKIRPKLYAAWEVTPLCNNDCIHCYRLSQDEEYISSDMPKIPKTKQEVEKILSTEKIKEGLNSLYAIGVRNFNIEGGEPTLRSDLDEIIQYAHQIGMEKIILSTNCHNILKKDKQGISLIEKIKDKLEYVSVSLDAAEADIHNEIRQGNSFEKVMNFIKWYSVTWEASKNRNEKIFKLKINITAQKLNSQSVLNIPEMLSQYLSPEMNVSLRLGKVQIRGRVKYNTEHVNLSQDDFQQISKKFSKSAEGYILRERNDENHVSSEKLPYLLVDFNGGLAIPDAVNNRHKKINYKNGQLNIFNKNFVSEYDETRDVDWEEMMESGNTYDNIIEK